MRMISTARWTAIMLTILCLTNSCKKENNGNNTFDEEAKLAYEAVVALQDSSDAVLAAYEMTMDSAVAVEALAQWFRGKENVEWAVVSGQGISVSYTNGMYGGIMIDPQRYGTDFSFKSAVPAGECGNDDYLKNLPSYRKARCLNAAMEEFFDADAYQFNNWKEAFNSLDYECVYNMDDEVKLEVLKDLRTKNDGIISLNSHGYAWPGNSNIEEVYFMTGQDLYVPTTESFYEDILEKRIIILKQSNGRSRYYISPDFLKKYNDWSNDTILFYGGFCYSFLGTWPKLTEACASGTYFGFDWAVRSDKCAAWAVDLIDYMADQSMDQPRTVEDWMSLSPIAKKYYSDKHKKDVHILYEGNSALTLWQPEYNAEGGIEAVAPDKAPILVPGKTCQEYDLKCIVNGQLPSQVYYFWDLGHETAFNMNQAGNLVTGRWGLPGSYTVKVQVKNQSNDEVIKEFTADIQIEDPSYLENVRAYQYFSTVFGSTGGPNITLTNGEQTSSYYFNFDTYYFTGALSWNDSAFSAIHSVPNGSGGETITINGIMSADGKTIEHCMIVQTELLSNGGFDYESKLELVDMPVFHHDEWNCWQWFQWNFTGAEAQGYIQNIEFKKYDYQEQEYVTIQSIDWGNSVLYGIFDNE